MIARQWKRFWPTTQRALQSGVESERLSLENSLARLKISEAETSNRAQRLRVADQYIDSTVASVILQGVREQLAASKLNLNAAAQNLRQAWAPALRSGPFTYGYTTVEFYPDPR